MIKCNFLATELINLDIITGFKDLAICHVISEMHCLSLDNMYFFLQECSAEKDL